MRLFTLLALVFFSLAALQAVVVVPLALGRLDTTLDRQLQSRIDAAVSAAEQTLAQRRREVARAMDDLAREEPEQAAAARMAARGLTVLSLLSGRGRVVDSGHLIARVGDESPELLELAKLGPEPRFALVEVRDDVRGLSKAPALVAGRAIEGSDEVAWAVGGVLLDARLAEDLAALTGAQVAVVSQGQSVARAGEAAPPLATRTLALSDATSLTLSFSRADALEARRQVQRDFLLLVGLGLVVSGAVGLWLARRITRPVAALTQATGRVARGELTARVHLRASGEIGQLVHAFNTMTEDLKRATEQLIASERIAAWQEVARRLAHEIKNPLTPIKMSLETLKAARSARSAQFDQLFEESSGVLLEEVERLRRIVDEFSRFARLPKPELKPLDAGELVEQVLSLYAAAPAGVALTPSLERGLAVRGDKDQLTQVLVNVVKNAFEAVGGGGRVEVRARRANEEVIIEVEDSGPGIAPEDRARIFEPYYTTKSDGTGLGLAISARIVQEHGGRLEVGGEVGQGAVLRLVLPALKN